MLGHQRRQDGPDGRQHLVLHPLDHLAVVVDHPAGADQLGQQHGGVGHPEGQVAEDPEGHHQPGLQVRHVVDRAAEIDVGDVAGGDEVQLGVVVGVAGEPVDQPAEGQRGPLAQWVPARPQGADHLARGW